MTGHSHVQAHVQAHIQDGMLVDYLTGDLDQASEATIEAHVAHCPACAQALTRHAQIETALYEVAASMPPAVSYSPWHRIGTAALAVVSMAAALVLAFGSPARWVQLEGQEPVAGLSGAATSADGLMTDADCVAQSTPEGTSCVEPLAVALATFPAEASWDSFSPDDGSDMTNLNWCAADEDDALVCAPGEGRPG